MSQARQWRGSGVRDDDDSEDESSQRDAVSILLELLQAILVR